MAQAIVINARLRERIMNAKDDRKRSGKEQKAVLFCKPHVAHFIEVYLKLLKQLNKYDFKIVSFVLIRNKLIS